jgi:hypothetical protein
MKSGIDSHRRPEKRAKLIHSVVFICFIGTLAAWAQPDTSGARRLTRVFKESGWDIPGLKHSHLKPGTIPHGTGVDNDFSYQVTVLVPESGQVLHVVPMVFVNEEKQKIIYQEWKVKVTQIRRFEIDGKPYCYQVSVMLHSEDPKTRASGDAGIVDLLYFDESGTGNWNIMDTGGILLPAAPRPAWVIKK